MKKLLAFLSLCMVIGTGAYADANKAILNCTIHGDNQSGLFLYQLKNGQAMSLGFKRPDENKKCVFEVDVKEGVYFFKKAGAGHGNNQFNYVIYLKAGDQKKLDFYISKSSNDYDSCVVEKPNVETKCLQTWLNAFNQYVNAVTSKHDQSYSKYEDLKKFATAFLQENKTDNTYFNGWLADKISTDINYLKAANYFKFGRLNAFYDSTATVQPFYKPLQAKEIVCDPRLLRSEHGMEMLDYIFAYRKFIAVKNTQDLLKASFSEYTSSICDDAVKVAYLEHHLPSITRYEDFVNYIQPYQNLFATDEQKAIYQKVYNNLAIFAKGRPGYNFELKDVNGKAYTLESFKGKIVVIDVWAMWCAPCLAEKPIYLKIEEQYKDRNDIVFIGISVDGLSRVEPWTGFVKKKGWTNIELLSNPTESLFKYYGISGIPRFLIFDREGKTVTVDAPRPSNPGFKKLIDETLAAGK
ncbi:MAG TPA: TlpA disulfide reductase family protein [Mucilaginibacter sp.]